MSEQFEQDFAKVLRDSAPQPDFDQVYGGALRRRGELRRRRQAGVASGVLGGVGVVALSASLALGGGMEWGGLGRDVPANTSSGTTVSTVGVLGSTTAERVATLPLTSRVWPGSADGLLVDRASFKLIGDCMKEKGFAELPGFGSADLTSFEGPWGMETVGGADQEEEEPPFLETMSPAEQDRYGEALFSKEIVSIDTVMGKQELPKKGCFIDALTQLAGPAEGYVALIQLHVRVQALESEAWQKLTKLPEYQGIEDALSACVRTKGGTLSTDWAGPTMTEFRFNGSEEIKIDCLQQTGFLDAAYPMLAEQQRLVAEQNADLLAEWDATHAEVVARAREVLAEG